MSNKKNMIIFYILMVNFNDENQNKGENHPNVLYFDGKGEV